VAGARGKGKGRFFGVRDIYQPKTPGAFPMSEGDGTSWAVGGCVMGEHGLV